MPRRSSGQRCRAEQPRSSQAVDEARGGAGEARRRGRAAASACASRPGDERVEDGVLDDRQAGSAELPLQLRLDDAVQRGQRAPALGRTSTASSAMPIAASFVARPRPFVGPQPPLVALPQMLQHTIADRGYQRLAVIRRTLLVAYASASDLSVATTSTEEADHARKEDYSRRPACLPSQSGALASD